MVCCTGTCLDHPKFYFVVLTLTTKGTMNMTMTNSSFGLRIGDIISCRT